MSNVLVGGVEKNKAASMFFIDYLGSMQKVPFAAHGYGSFFVMGLFDKNYHKGMNVQEGIELMKKAVSEIQKRLVLNAPHFIG